MEKISVIIPVYNTEKYLEKCVSSVLSQTYKELEIILIDDGSNDSSGEICDELEKTDSRIIVLHQSNAGPSSARNAGIDAATGNYLGFVDSDDWIEPQMYEFLYERLLSGKADISCCNIRRRRGEEEIPIIKDLSLDAVFSGYEAALRALDDNEKIIFSLDNKLFRKELFDGIRLQVGTFFEDFQIIPELLMKAETVICSGLPLYNYYESQGSTLRGEYSLKLFDYVKVCRNNIDFYREYCPEGYDRIREIYIGKCLDIVFRSFNNREWDINRAEIIKDLKKMANSDIYERLRKNIKIKLKLLFLSPSLYYCAALVNRSVKRIMKREEIIYDTANGF